MPEPYNRAEEKPWEPVDKIMLAEAVLCEDCTAITKAKNGHCLACGGHSLLNLAALLNRVRDTDEVKTSDEINQAAHG